MRGGFPTQGVRSKDGIARGSVASNDEIYDHTSSLLVRTLCTALPLLAATTLPVPLQAWSRLAGRPSARSARTFEQCVRSSSILSGIEKPTQSYDPNHWKKVFRGNDKGGNGATSLIAIKKRLKITNVLGAEDQSRLVELLATCIKQHRETARPRSHLWA